MSMHVDALQELPELGRPQSLGEWCCACSVWSLVGTFATCLGCTITN